MPMGIDDIAASAIKEAGTQSLEKLQPTSNTSKMDELRSSIYDKLDLGDKSLPKDNRLEEIRRSVAGRVDSGSNVEKTERDGLTAEEKADIGKETGWSDKTLDNIGSKEEAEIYKEAGLHEEEVDGKPCLVRDDIDLEQKDDMGRSNQERMEQGLAPLDSDGNPIELHHIGQHSDSPLAELKQEEHRGKGNDAILHDKTKESEIDRGDFAKERSEHWRARA